MVTSLWQRVVTWALLVAVTVMFLLPLVWVLITSVKPTVEIYGQTEDSEGTIHILPRRPTLDHYRHVLTELSDFPIYVLSLIHI